MEAKQVVQKTKCKAYDKLYSKLGTKEGKKDISKLAKTREMKVSKQEHIKL